MRCLPTWAIVGTTAILALYTLPSAADNISPTGETGTQVTTNGPDHTITGGTVSADNQNLFHSFTEFSLPTGQSATFVTDPTILNILGGVQGATPSIIDGLLQVSGSNANLFLINPNGILLGPNSALNLQGSFTAVTADQVNFATGAFAIGGEADYAALVGAPQSFSFGLANPASVVNAGNLRVLPGESVILMGGQILNIGTVAAPGGEVVISTVEGGERVRITQAGSLLNLEVATLAEFEPRPTPFSPLSLPELLTGSAIAATAVTQQSDGTVQLASGDPVSATPGTLTVAGVLDVAANQGGQILLQGDDIALPSGLIDISGSEAGGQLDVYAIADLALGISVNAAGGGRVLFDPPSFTVNAPEAATLLSTLNTAGSATISAAETITLNAAIDNSDQPTAPFGFLAFTDEDANGNLTINLNAPIRLTFSQFLVGDGSEINVATTGLVQNALALAIEGATINLAAGTFQAGEPLFLNQGITLSGAGAESTILDGNNGYQVISVAPSSDPATPPAMVRNLTIANGFNPEGLGGGISNAGDLVIDNSVIRDNQALDAGGGISNERLDLIPGVNEGRLVITNSTIRNNSAGTDGGGIYNDGGSLRISNSTLNNNSSNGFGGAINDINGTVNITNSTIANNFALTGGGLSGSSGSSLTVANSTFVGNRARGSGGGIASAGIVNLISNLLSGNESATAASANLVYLGLDNISSANNLFGANGDAGITGFTVAASDVVPAMPLSQIVSTTLANNGGPTQTLALVAGSPAIDAGRGTAADQRGVAVSNGVRDIGAYERVNLVEGGEGSGGGSNPPDPEAECVASDCNAAAEPEADLSVSDATEDGSEVAFVEEFEDFLGVEAMAFVDLEALDRARSATGVESALVYASFVPPNSDAAIAAGVEDGVTAPRMANKAFATAADFPSQIVAQAAGRVPTANTREDTLQLVLVTANREPLRIDTGATRSEVLAAVRQLQFELTDRTRRRLDNYLVPAQALYGWLMAPLETALAAEEIGHVSFVLDQGLRSLPLAALHDGGQFIIENYSVGLMPSLSLTDTRIGNIRNVEVLAMGASEFGDQPPLPAVPLEIAAINEQWAATVHLNETFTPETLIDERSSDAYPILHLATHGQFTSGALSNSYIQFWDRRLGLNELPQLRLSDPAVELLVLSACRTVLGNEEAELGFAGLAIKSGAKSAIAALWQVSDLETAGLMAELYTQLGQVTYKAEALRQAQLAMLRGEVTVQAGDLVWSGGREPLPAEFTQPIFADTSHPYYWSAFTLVGNPW